MEASVKTVYSECKTPKNMILHMQRVAALAQIICDNWRGPKINNKNIIDAAALHDIAKPISFDFRKQSKFELNKKETLKLIKFVTKLRNKFGKNEHDAAVWIAKKYKFSKDTARIVSNTWWARIEKLINKKEFDSLIVNYSDMRIGFNGLLTIEERIADLKLRKKTEDFDSYLRDGKKAEKLIQKYVKVNLNSINKEEVENKAKKETDEYI